MYNIQQKSIYLGLKIIEYNLYKITKVVYSERYILESIFMITIKYVDIIYYITVYSRPFHYNVVFLLIR